MRPRTSIILRREGLIERLALGLSAVVERQVSRADGEAPGLEGTIAAGLSSAHIASLDAVRGVAVLLVMLFHFGWTFPSSNLAVAIVHDVIWTGWIGVDMFFALSGFLITRGLIAPSHRGSGERLRRFWMRRILRIVPIYYLTLAVGSVVAWLARTPAPSLAYWAYLQNYSIAVAPMHQIDWTGHFWSLAVEEQFYLFWPLAMLLVRPASRIPITVALFLAGAATRAGLHFFGVSRLGMDPGHLPKLLYCATPTHMDGLLLGALVAMLQAEPSHPLARFWRRWRRPGAGAATLAVLALAALTARGGLGKGVMLSQYDGRVAVLGYPLLAFLFASLVYELVDRPPRAAPGWPRTRRALSSCGKVSYGMYVLNWPMARTLIAPIEDAHLSWWRGAALVVAIITVGVPLTWLLAQLSFRYFETPFLELKARFSG